MTVQVQASDLVNYMSLKDSARYFPRPDGKKASIKTVYRYGLHGVRGVRLKTMKVGAVLCTCEAWISDFVNQLNAGSVANDVRPAETRATPGDVGRRLDKIGV